MVAGLIMYLTTYKQTVKTLMMNMLVVPTLQLLELVTLIIIIKDFTILEVTKVLLTKTLLLWKKLSDNNPLLLCLLLNHRFILTVVEFMLIPIVKITQSTMQWPLLGTVINFNSLLAPSVHRFLVGFLIG